MKVLTLSDAEVHKALPYEKLIPHMKQALIDFSLGEVICPQRNVLLLTQGNALGYMPSFSRKTFGFGVKVATVFPRNRDKKIDIHQGVVVLFDSESGRPQCILNASEITARRTAATSAAATDLFTEKEVAHLTVFGFGVQAKEHIKAICTIREIKTLKVYTRSEIKENSLDINIQFCKEAKEAIEGAEVICLCTSARASYLSTKHLPVGVHVNAIGACRPEQKEISIESDSNVAIFVDSRESVSIESCEINATNAHLIKGELGEALSGVISGKMDNNEITIFKSVGLSVQDIYAAQLAVEEAKRMGLGKEVDF